MKIGGTLKVFVVANIKLPVVFTLISLGFVSQGFAVLRPPFPVKAVSPYNGEVIITGDDLVPGSKRTPGNLGINGHNQMKRQLTQVSTNTQSKASFYSPMPSLVPCRCGGYSSLPFHGW